MARKVLSVCTIIRCRTRKKYNYYEFKSGDIRTRYADTADGLCKSAVNNMAAYADDISCAELILKVSPVYIADTMDTEAVKNSRRKWYPDDFWREQCALLHGSGVRTDRFV